MKIEAGKYYKTRDGQKVGPMWHNGDDPEPFVWTSKEGGIWSHSGEDGLASGPIGSPTKRDIIAEWTEDQIGTLEELDVKPGDVVTWHAPKSDHYNRYNAFTGIEMTVCDDLGVNFVNPNVGRDGFSYACGHKFRLISRATTTPSIDLTAITTPFGLLDKATQDALVAHGGPYVYFSVQGVWYDTDNCSDKPGLAHRVKPGPKRETVTKDAFIWNSGSVDMSGANCTITYDTIDGVIDMATYRVVAK